jgi:hypothetical protein
MIFALPPDTCYTGISGSEPNDLIISRDSLILMMGIIQDTL